ncbi:MAG: hypothetical protein JW982_14840 [Spirochaetes bacterium]|nr:hypothetical protein [Spirochaetota bacterium]
MTMMFITYSNAIDEEIVDLVKMYNKGYTKFRGVQGEGNGEPHLGTHVWPSVNNCMMVVMENKNVNKLLKDLHILENKFTGIGIKVFSTEAKQIY